MGSAGTTSRPTPKRGRYTLFTIRLSPVCNIFCLGYMSVSWAIAAKFSSQAHNNIVSIQCPYPSFLARHSQVSSTVFHGPCDPGPGFLFGRPDGGPTCDYMNKKSKVHEMATSHSKKPYRKKAGAIFSSIN